MKTYLPSKDRSYWSGVDTKLPLRYLAWGSRNFHDEPIPQSQHEGWICVLITEGSPSLLIQDQELLVSKGDFILLGPDCHTGWSTKNKSDCKFLLWMWDSISTLSDKGDATNRKSYWLKGLSNRDRRPYIQLHEMCRQEVLSLSEQSHTFMNGCKMILETLIHRSKETNSQPQLESMRIADDWIQNNLDSQQPVTRLGDYLNISQPSLYRLFKENLNQSPQNYITQLKRKEGFRLLTETSLSIKEIAYSLGYKHFSDFSRAMKKTYGISCTQIRGSSQKEKLVHKNQARK